MKRIYCVCFFCAIIFFPTWSKGQNFDKRKYEKRYFYQVGLGVGDFFLVEQGSDVNSKLLPSLSGAFGRRMNSYFGLKSTVSIQSFIIEQPVAPFKGLSYALDLMPTVNLFANRSQLDLPRINAELGMGVGYLINYISKEIVIGDSPRDLQYLEFSPYIPIRLALTIRFKRVNNLGVEGVFFNTWLDPNKQNLFEIKKNANQFGQINLVMRRFLF